MCKHSPRCCWENRGGGSGDGGVLWCVMLAVLTHQHSLLLQVWPGGHVLLATGHLQQRKIKLLNVICPQLGSWLVTMTQTVLLSDIVQINYLDICQWYNFLNWLLPYSAMADVTFISKIICKTLLWVTVLIIGGQTWKYMYSVLEESSGIVCVSGLVVRFCFTLIQSVYSVWKVAEYFTVKHWVTRWTSAFFCQDLLLLQFSIWPPDVLRLSSLFHIQLLTCVPFS